MDNNDFESPDFDDPEMDNPESNDLELDTFDFETSEFDNDDFETSRIETYDSETYETNISRGEVEDVEIAESIDSEFEPSINSEVVEAQDSQRHAHVVAPISSAKSEPIEGYEKVERFKNKRARQKSGSFMRTMDGLVIGAAVSLLGLWLLGHCLLWLIGNSGSPKIASADSAGSNFAVAELDSDKTFDTANSKQQEANSNASSQESNVSAVLTGDTERSSAQQLGASDGLSESNAERQSDANQFTTTPAQTSLRPAFPELTAKSESETKTAIGVDATETTAVEPRQVETADGWTSTDEAKAPAEEGSNQFQFGRETQPLVEEPATNFGRDEGPIGEIEEPAELTELTEPEPVVTEPKTTQPLVFEPERATELPKAPKTYPMRVWTSSRGTKANLALVRVQDGKVVVVDEKGKLFALGFDRFSPEDQAYVADAIRN